MSQRVLACVTFHYAAARLGWLKQTLNCFAAYPFPVHLIILTNAHVADEASAIERAIPPGRFTQAEVRHVGGLQHPFELTWAHKPIIANEFSHNGDTHFIYVEDDILIPPEAFGYWVKHRPALDRRGLIPGFVRVERAHASGVLFTTDQMGPTQLDYARMVRVGGWTFTNLNSSYVGSFILDRALADEYVASRSFSLAGSAAVKTNWGVRERAAMGLCFENVPRFFWSRLVVPFHRKTLQVPGFAHVTHAPANYANDPASDLARIRVDGMLLPPSLQHYARERGRTVWRLLGSSVARFSGGPEV